MLSLFAITLHLLVGKLTAIWPSAYVTPGILPERQARLLNSLGCACSCLVTAATGTSLSSPEVDVCHHSAHVEPHAKGCQQHAGQEGDHYANYWVQVALRPRQERQTKASTDTQ